MSKEAMKLALEKIASALPAYIDGVASREYLATIHKALAEQPAQQEPVALKWQQAPIRTAWGDDMVVASVAIDKDHTLCLYCERDQTPKVDAVFAQRTWVGLTADDLKEPKNGEQWRVEWWNESCRMMLPSDMKLDRSVVWKNGTVQFTIKKSAHGIKENT